MYVEKKRKRAEVSIKPNTVDISEEMQQLQWRLELLRSNRVKKENNNGSIATFNDIYEAQKFKYQKFRERQKRKVSDPQYLEMIGSMHLQREKRKMESLQKIEDGIFSVE